MFYYTSLQGAVFPVFALCGALIAAVFSVCAALRRRFPSAAFSVISQALSAAVCLILLLITVTATNQGSLRLYMLLALIIGALIFLAGVYIPIRRLISRLSAKRGGGGNEAGFDG